MIAACVFLFDNWQLNPEQIAAMSAGHPGLRVPSPVNPQRKSKKKK